MKRLKTFATCCIAAICACALLVLATGCASDDYQPEEKSPTLETPTIGVDGTLRVGVNVDNQPMAGTSSSDNIVGIDVDIAAALADDLGLKLEVTDVGVNGETALGEETVDIVMGMEKSEDESLVWTSDAYMPSAIALFAKKGNDEVPESGKDLTIAAQVSSKSAWAVTNDFEKATLTTSSDLQSAFESLENDEVQYVASDAIVGMYAAYTAGYDVHIVAIMDQSDGYSIGVLDSNSDLKTAISDSLANVMGAGLIGVIESKWLGSELDLSDIPTVGSGSSKNDDSKSDKSDKNDKSDKDDKASDSSKDTGEAAGNAVTKDDLNGGEGDDNGESDEGGDNGDSGEGDESQQ